MMMVWSTREYVRARQRRGGAACALAVFLCGCFVREAGFLIQRTVMVNRRRLATAGRHVGERCRRRHRRSVFKNTHTHTHTHTPKPSKYDEEQKTARAKFTIQTNKTAKQKGLKIAKQNMRFREFGAQNKIITETVQKRFKHYTHVAHASAARAHKITKLNTKD
jgi:hypothetical protein